MKFLFCIALVLFPLSSFSAFDCRSLLRNVTPTFERLIPTSGFRDYYYAFRNALIDHKITAEVLAILEQQDFDIVIYRPEDSRENIARRGFSNFHMTHRSKGDMGGNDYLESALYRRNNIEANYLQIDPENYKRIPHEVKPKYGILRLSTEYADHEEPREVARDYGSDSFRLKKSEIRERTAFVIGDSIDKLTRNKDARQNDYKKFALNIWDKALIPWEFRGMMTIEIFTRFEKKLGLSIDYARFADRFPDFINRRSMHSLRPYARSIYIDFFQHDARTWANGATYIEAQVFGALTLKDVEAFEFRENPPSGRFLQALRRHGIEIYDARVWPPKEWEG